MNLQTELKAAHQEMLREDQRKRWENRQLSEARAKAWQEQMEALNANS